MPRKGKLAEIFSKAKFADNPNSYLVGYLDFGVLKEVTLPEFLDLSDNFQTIPITRIKHVKKGNTVLFSRADNKRDSDPI